VFFDKRGNNPSCHPRALELEAGKRPAHGAVAQRDLDGMTVDEVPAHARPTLLGPGLVLAPAGETFRVERSERGAE